MADGQSMTVADVVAKMMDGRLEDFAREAVALVARELMEVEARHNAETWHAGHVLVLGLGWLGAGAFWVEIGRYRFQHVVVCGSSGLRRGTERCTGRRAGPSCAVRRSAGRGKRTGRRW
ncbi:MAG TPA: hypothetical protein VEF89_15370 [Solirubrobacteraceae bacterium]|nr:hypothetical protein [Solirubrobacteraceae bacterium]